MLVRRALAGQLDHDGVADELADEALALFMQAYAGGHELTAVYPGVRDCLDWLRERRVKLAEDLTGKPIDDSHAAVRCEAGHCTCSYWP